MSTTTSYCVSPNTGRIRQYTVKNVEKAVPPRPATQYFSTTSSQQSYVCIPKKKKSRSRSCEPRKRTHSCEPKKTHAHDLDYRPYHASTNFTGKISRNSSRHSLSSDGRLSRRHSDHSLRRQSSLNSLLSLSSIYSHKNSHSVLRDKSDNEYSLAQIRNKVFDLKVSKFSSNLSILTKTVNRNYKGKEDPISQLISNCKKAKQIVHDFSNEVFTRGWRLQVVEPKRIEIAYVKYSKHYHREVIKYKQGVEEPFLRNITKYTSNSGWYKDSNKVPVKLIIALCRYSYQWSDREYMLCKIHADINFDHKVITIASPGFHSKYGDVFGPEDLGIKGIRNFFYWVPSNRYCKEFIRPKHLNIYYQPDENTLTSYYD